MRTTRRIRPLTATLTAAVLAAGCGVSLDLQTPTDVAAGQDPLLSLENGGQVDVDSETDEAPGFGSDDFLAEFDSESDIDESEEDVPEGTVPERDCSEDALAAGEDCAPRPEPRPRRMFVRFVWGQLRANSNVPAGSDWSGGLHARGAQLRLRREIRFEERDQILPSPDRSQVLWRSHTRPHNDGVLVEITPDMIDPANLDGTAGGSCDGRPDDSGRDPGDADSTDADDRDPNNRPDANRSDRTDSGADRSRDDANDPSTGVRPDDDNARRDDGQPEDDTTGRDEDGDPNTRPDRPPHPCPPPPAQVTFRTRKFSMTFDLRELANIDRVVRVDRMGNALLVQAVDPAPQCMSGFLEGRWLNIEGTGGGVFGGRWMSRNGNFAGVTFGRYGINSAGERAFRGKIIRRDGSFLGRLGGTWTPYDELPAATAEDHSRTDAAGASATDANGNTASSDPNAGAATTDPATGEDPNVRPVLPAAGGIFDGQWQTRGGHLGILGGHYTPGGSGSGFYSGRWVEICGGPIDDNGNPDRDTTAPNSGRSSNDGSTSPSGGR